MVVAASAVILAEGRSQQPVFEGLDAVLAQEDTQLRLFGKPEVQGERRMGVVLARDDTVEKAKEKAIKGAQAVSVKL